MTTENSTIPELNINDFLENIDHADSGDEVWDLLSNFCSHSGLTGICCRCFPSEAETDKSVIFASTRGFSISLAEALATLSSSEDPMLYRALHSARPFKGNQLDQKNHSQAFKLVWSELDKELKNTTIVPVFGPLIRNGYFCFVGNSARDISVFNPNIFHIVGQTSYLRLCDLMYGSADNSTKLSRRECEVLRNVANGKTNAEIAKLLGVSVRTVETYLIRIFDKLGVRDRVRAALRAYALGLLA